MKYLLCLNCGNLLEVSSKEKTCCNVNMQEVIANEKDASLEKHVPVINIDGTTINVAVGDILHPMEENHFIKWIYLKTTKQIYKVDLKPNDRPIATFNIDQDEKVILALAYCNIHGLWSSK